MTDMRKVWFDGENFLSETVPTEDIYIEEWNGLTDKHKVLLIRNAPNWTTLQLIEEVETMLKGLNK